MKRMVERSDNSAMAVGIQWETRRPRRAYSREQPATLPVSPSARRAVRMAPRRAALVTRRIAIMTTMPAMAAAMVSARSLGWSSTAKALELST